MATFKLSGRLNVPMRLLVPTYSVVQAVEVKTYPEAQDGILIFGSFRTFGGTERESNGLYFVEDTATIETWYRSDIKTDCRIYIPSTGQTYEIVSPPENVRMENQFLQFKVRNIRGRA